MSSPEPATESPARRLGRLIREAREDAGYTQDQLAAASGIGRATIQRLENAKNVPELDTVRAVALAIPGLDPREIPVALGLVTRDEMGLPAARDRARQFDEATEEILALLVDPRLSREEKVALRELLRARLATRPAAEAG